MGVGGSSVGGGCSVAVAVAVGVGELLDGNSMAGTAVSSTTFAKVGIETGLAVDGTAVLAVRVTSGADPPQADKKSKAIIGKTYRRFGLIFNL
jgi:hypothetical protein